MSGQYDVHLSSPIQSIPLRQFLFRWFSILALWAILCGSDQELLQCVLYVALGSLPTFGLVVLVPVHAASRSRAHGRASSMGRISSRRLVSLCVVLWPSAIRTSFSHTHRTATGDSPLSSMSLSYASRLPWMPSAKDSMRSMVSISQLPSLSLNAASLTYRPRCLGET